MRVILQLFAALYLSAAAVWATTCADVASGTCDTCERCCRSWLAGSAAAPVCAACVEVECASPNSCEPSSCNVCPHCCGVGGGQGVCDACVFDYCGGKQSANDRRCALAAEFDCQRHTPNSTCSERCVSECWYHPFSACLRDCSLCEAGHRLTVAVLLPYLGRALLEQLAAKLGEWFTQKTQKVDCCRKRRRLRPPLGGLVAGATGLLPADGEAAGLLPTDGETQRTGYTLAMVLEKDSSWESALVANNSSPCGATLSAIVRLGMWHLLQPLLYFIVLSCYWSELDMWQRGFGSAVAVREAMYLIATTSALWLNPSFLLIDVAASVRDKDTGGIKGGLGFLTMYVFAPEKYVTFALGQAIKAARNDDSQLFVYIVFGMALLDLCGVGALLAGECCLSPNNRQTSSCCAAG